MYGMLPPTEVARVLGKQVLRSGTSVGANYREGCRAHSDAEFVSKLQIGLQELEETAYGLELLAESNIYSAERLQPLLTGTDELTAILTASVKTVKQRIRS